MIKVIVISLIVVVAGILLFAATRPDTFRVQRSERINASPEKILPLINDFHQWGVWSPYEKLDPAMKRTYGGTPAGKGAVYEWNGNSKAGAGRMEIIEAGAAGTVIQLDFTQPLVAHNVARFTAQPQGDATLLSWSMEGPAPYIQKVLGLFLNMDRMIGGEFELGLSNLKAVAEK